MIYFLIGIIIGYFIPSFLFIKLKNSPSVIENKILENSKLPTKIYTIINSDGEKETIITTKSMSELMSELDTLTNKG